MDLAVIRNEKQREDLIKSLTAKRLPIKVVTQEMYPTRSIAFNDYLWGFVYAPIAEETGHTIEEVHEACKQIYNFRCDFRPGPGGQWHCTGEVDSTTVLDRKEAWEYAARIRADAEIELGVTIALPDEVFIPELIFEAEL
jgi:hypothetical protein